MIYNGPRARVLALAPGLSPLQLPSSTGPPASFSYCALRYSPPYMATNTQSSVSDRDLFIAQVPHCMVMEGKGNNRQGLLLLLKQSGVQVPKVIPK